MKVLSKKQKTNLFRIIAATVLFLIATILPSETIAKPIIYMAAYIVVGYDVLFGAVRNVCAGHLFDENFLMAIATIGAVCIGEYPEAVFVMLFFQVGELFQNIAVGRSRKSISDLMNIAPESANILRDGEFCEAFPEEIEIGDILLVKPGEKIPIDGVVIKGESDIDTSSMTGESVPRFASVGDNVISGCVNMSSPLEIKAEKEYSESTVTKVLELVEHSALNKGKYENFITRFAHWYTPTVVVLALLVAFVPPIFAGELKVWILRALSFLVVSCPCALVISVPLGFFGGIGAASKRGVLVKGSTYLEVLEKCKVVVTDKTGTLTDGKLFVLNHEGEDTINIAASVERFSNHPVAKAIVKAADKEYNAENVCEIAGKGICGKLDGKDVLVGNRLLLEDYKVKTHESDATVFVAFDGKCIGSITVGDKTKENVEQSVDELHKNGVKKVVMLTGDGESGARKVFDETGIDEMYYSLLPAEKVEMLEKIMSESDGTTVYLGDGINDAPVLKRADCGIAMGAMGSDAAIEASDIVFMNDDFSLLNESIRIAKKTVRIVRENIVFSIAVKVFVLILTALGYADMWQAVFADVGVMVIAVLNTLRTLRL